MSINRRVARLEGGADPEARMPQFVGGPPPETREEWLARKAGDAPSEALNAVGETREQWFARKDREREERLALRSGASG